MQSLHQSTFTARLEAFKFAAARLAEAWGDVDPSILGETYPSYLPDFDSFVADVQAMQAEENPRVVEINNESDELEGYAILRDGKLESVIYGTRSEAHASVTR
jgi:hypothetical protein